MTNIKKIVGVVLCVLGIAGIIVSNYISNQVAEGKLKIAKGQSQVDQGKRLFSLSPATKEMGKGMTDSAQRKIDAGKGQVQDYETIARELEIGGIILIVAGAVVFLLGCGHKEKKR